MPKTPEPPDGPDQASSPGKGEPKGSPLTGSAFLRTARLASLPLGFAGRTTSGPRQAAWSGRPRTSCSPRSRPHRRAALLRARRAQGRGDEVRPGDVIFEAALPEELSGPTARRSSSCRTPRRRCRRPRPPRDGRGVRSRWRQQFTSFDDNPAASASIGQVHRAVWADGREVAVKVQYPGAGEALTADLARSPAWRGCSARCCPGIDVKPLVAGAAGPGRRGARLPARGRGAEALRRRVRRRPGVVVPRWSAYTEHGAGLDVAGERPLPGAADRRRHAGGARPLRRGLRPVPVRRAGPDRDAARRSSPGQLPASARRPARRRRLRRRRAAARRAARADRPAAAAAPSTTTTRGARRPARRGIRQAGRSTSTPTSCATTSARSSSRPSVDDVPVLPSGCGSRPSGSRARARRRSAPRRMNLPPAYLLIHRVWLGGDRRALPARRDREFRAMLEESLPGFAEAEAACRAERPRQLGVPPTSSASRGRVAAIRAASA